MSLNNRSRISHASTSTCNQIGEKCGFARMDTVYVISSDTLVETPKIVEYIDASLDRMNAAAKQQGLPFTAHKVTPTTDSTFWVNLMGRGYPVPSNQFRWCTERLKINPANSFILDRVAEHGEVVVVLGVRIGESSTRDQVMSLHRITGSHLARHSNLPKAFVYAPIETFSVHDVRTYLLQVPSPWGNDNRALVTLYRNAQAGECPSSWIRPHLLAEIADLVAGCALS
jgi:DNA sulfur modification protein DndC